MSCPSAGPAGPGERFFVFMYAVNCGELRVCVVVNNIIIDLIIPFI